MIVIHDSLLRLSPNLAMEAANILIPNGAVMGQKQLPLATHIA